MTLLSQIGREILGLFVDDGPLALRILLVVCAAAAMAFFAFEPRQIGAVLVIGTIVVLTESVWRATRR
jgi:hypothetical protein